MIGLPTPEHDDRKGRHQGSGPKHVSRRFTCLTVSTGNSASRTRNTVFNKLRCRTGMTTVNGPTIVRLRSSPSMHLFRFVTGTSISTTVRCGLRFARSVADLLDRPDDCEPSTSLCRSDRLPRALPCCSQSLLSSLFTFVAALMYSASGIFRERAPSAFAAALCSHRYDHGDKTRAPRYCDCRCPSPTRGHRVVEEMAVHSHFLALSDVHSRSWRPSSFSAKRTSFAASRESPRRCTIQQQDERVRSRIRIRRASPY